MELTLYEIQQQIESLEITNEKECENANKLFKECNRLIKEVQAKHKPIKDETNKAHRKACADEKAELEPYKQAKSVISKALKEYKQNEEKRRIEVEKAQKEELEIFGEVMTDDYQADLGGTHFRTTWKARIIDEDKVPIKWNGHEIRPVNMSALNEIARNEQGKAEIEGVEFYQYSTPIAG